MSKLTLLTNLRRAHAATGRSYLDLAVELVRLRRDRGLVGAAEYFDNRLYETDLSYEQKRAFCGYRAQHLLEDVLVDNYSAILSLDKLTFYQLMQGYGFPTPRVQACYAEKWRAWSGRTLLGPAALRQYLYEEAAYPFYLKPSYGAYGRGNTLVRARTGDELALGDGSSIAIDRFCASLPDPTGLGWLLQEALLPHPEIARVCGDRVSSLRVHTFLGRDGVEVHRLVWKVNVGRMDSDNFSHGASGNMLADVDMASGRVTRVVTGLAFDQREVTHHPLTGESLTGFAVPGFHAALDMARRASPIFPGFICPGWDIALCESGPVALEINMFGDVDLPQHSMRRGFLDESLLALMRERGLEPYLSMPADPTHVNSTGRRGRRRGHWPY